MSQTKDPVFYLEQAKVECGQTTPGWYFYDETWCWAYGPYSDRETAVAKCKQYAEEVLG